MTATHYAGTTARPATRWLLLGSLALNLFFVGIAIAMAVRPAPPARNWDRDVFVRTERLAEGLPKEDGAILIAQMNANRNAIESTQKQYRATQEAIREAIRKEPFDADALRAAMSETRAARQAFDSAVQNAFAAATAQMSQPGRVALADWRSRRGGNDRNR
ncbi:MAG TPA: periplasmic heavy metal sensor [Pseudolabrys sp.]|nr:periplasmic heavy metal sensor [Pseudolabrys sp.]